MQVIKANKIIPKIIKITESIGVLEIPKTCPVCDAPAHIIESESGTKTLHCSNPDCTAKQLKKFTRFVSKDGLDIDGISEQTVSTFINEGWIKEYADFELTLRPTYDFIMELQSYGTMIEVMEPQSLRQTMKCCINDLSRLYKSD